MKKNDSVKDLIKKAFIQLISKKPYLEITVTDIVKIAGVARVSYYRNYSSIDEIMNDFIDNIVSGFGNEILPIISLGADEESLRFHLKKFFERSEKMQERFSFIKSINAPFIFSHLEKRISQIESTFDEKNINKYLLHIKICIINAVERKWISSKNKETPEELANLIAPILSKI